MIEDPGIDLQSTAGPEAALRARLWEIHWAVRTFMPFVARIAIAIYDPKTALLQVFADSSEVENPVPRGRVVIGTAPSLRKLLDEGNPRVIRNLLTFEEEGREPSNRLGRSGFAASYTLPVFSNGAFLGFVFLNSRDPGAFTETALSQLGVFGHIASLLVIEELEATRALTFALESARSRAAGPGSGTGSPLDRMSRYAGLIARALASRAGRDEEFVALVEAYAPIHDIGKNGLPDAIILKPGRFTSQELEVMRTHVHRGKAIVESLVTHFGLEALGHIDLARNIVLHHHERVDGTGYPHGLAGDAIPLEARIAAAADVFDALTSRRPYRGALDNAAAFAELERLAGNHLDPDCVRAIVDAAAGIEAIQASFREDPVG